MIFDSLANSRIYLGLSPNIARAIHFLNDPSVLDRPVGRQEIDGDRVFALVQRYTTKIPNEGLWEAHRRYIDIQFVVSGNETMRYAPIETMTPSNPYDTEKDFTAYLGDGQSLIVGARQFAIFFAHDVHMPQLAASVPSAVHKIVVKVAVD